MIIKTRALAIAAGLLVSGFAINAQAADKPACEPGTHCMEQMSNMKMEHSASKSDAGTGDVPSYPSR